MPTYPRPFRAPSPCPGCWPCTPPAAPSSGGRGGATPQRPRTASDHTGRSRRGSWGRKKGNKEGRGCAGPEFSTETSLKRSNSNLCKVYSNTGDPWNFEFRKSSEHCVTVSTEKEEIKWPLFEKKVTKMQHLAPTLDPPPKKSRLLVTRYMSILVCRCLSLPCLRMAPRCPCAPPRCASSGWAGCWKGEG